MTLSENVTSISKFAFAHCRLLSSITIPEKVVLIGRGAFDGCNDLEAITISSGNLHFILVKGFLFNKNGELIFDPTMKEEIHED